jgi:hypothetical protein
MMPNQGMQAMPNGMTMPPQHPGMMRQGMTGLPGQPQLSPEQSGAASPQQMVSGGMVVPPTMMKAHDFLRRRGGVEFALSRSVSWCQRSDTFARRSSSRSMGCSKWAGRHSSRSSKWGGSIRSSISISSSSNNSR